MAKIPQTQFVNALDKINQPGTLTDAVYFGKNNVWYIRVINSDHLSYYELHHYDTLIAKITVQPSAIDVTYLDIHSGSDRDGINSLLHILGAPYKVNLYGERKHN